jgi:hypothetical protein
MFFRAGLDDPNQVEAAREIRFFAHGILQAMRRSGEATLIGICPSGESNAGSPELMTTSDLLASQCAAPIQDVVPAKAGTHCHRRWLSVSAADVLLIEQRGMGPGLRRDDEGARRMGRALRETHQLGCQERWVSLRSTHPTS